MADAYAEEEEFETRFDGRTLRRLFGLNLRHGRLLALFTASVVGIAVVDSYFTFLSKRIVDEAIAVGNMAMLQRLLVHYGVTALALSLTIFGFIYGAGILGERIRYDLCRRLFARLQELSLSYFDRTPVGWLMARLTSDARRVGEMVSWGFLDLIWGSANIVAALVFMTLISWQLALIMLAIIPALLAVAIKFQAGILREYRAVRRTNSRITGAFNESITGVRVAKALGREQANYARFQELTAHLFASSYRAAWLSALFLPAVQLITACAVGGILWFGGWQFQRGDITVGGLQAFVSYITFMLFPIQEMSRVFAEMQQAIAAGERVFSLLDAQPEITDQPGAAHPPHMRGDIEFRGVHFAYADGTPVFADLNLRVPYGETVALVGPTGAGKTTLVNLLCRFYEPQQGQICIDGQDLQTLTQASIQSRMGMVLQTPHLFAGTIRDNIRYGRLDARDDEVVAAARLAGAHAFIQALPAGYDAQVGEEGLVLSVGQRQLISIARALLAQPDIFVMDEATSSVDTLTESLIQQGMAAIVKDRTSFVIAHRLSTIRQADRILVIRRGGIAEEGSHSQLLQACGYYHDLYARQFREERTRALDPFRGVSPLPAPL